MTDAPDEPAARSARPHWTDRVAVGKMIGQLEVVAVVASAGKNGAKAKVRCMAPRDGLPCGKEESRNVSALYTAATSAADSMCKACFRTRQRLKRGAVLRRHPNGARK